MMDAEWIERQRAAITDLCWQEESLPIERKSIFATRLMVAVEQVQREAQEANNDD